MRGQTIGGLKPETKRRFDTAKLHYKSPGEPLTTSEEFISYLLNLHEINIGCKNNQTEVKNERC